MKLKRQTEPISVFNPLSRDFTIKKNFDGKDHTFTVHALESEMFPRFIAEHIKKALSMEVMNTRGVKVNSEEDLKNIYKEISGDI